MQCLVQASAPREAPNAMQRLKRGRIRQIIAYHAYRTTYQPLLRLSDDRIEGRECLTRFELEPYRSPDQWFQDASEVGLGLDLEFETMAAGLKGLAAMPPCDYLALNISPEALRDPRLCALLAMVDLSRIVLELTEHAPVCDYGPILRILAPLRSRGLRVAVDDVGAGYANLRHILCLKPDMIKLDISLTRDIQHCPAQIALLAGLVPFGKAIGARIVAEGVETVPQLRQLRGLGVDVAQGYLLGRPI